jgi:NADH-quinone oxidoreductase subunit M
MSVLNLIILIPILAAAAILLGAPARRTAFGAAVLNLILVLAALFRFDPASGDRFQFTSSFTVLSSLDMKYFVGADGLTLVMLLLTALVTLAAVWVTPEVAKFEKQFYACLLFISAGAAGAFASLDLFFFYAFHELALIPTFLLIGIWGSGDRQAAAWKITIYLAVGSFVLLIGLIGLYQILPESLRTFDIPKLQEYAAAGKLNTASANSIYLLLLIGFGILVSLFPFHTWAPQAYASAPAPAAMLHAGVLKKFGLYGLLRVALPLLPGAATQPFHLRLCCHEFVFTANNLLLVLLVGNIIYVGLVTIAQKRLDLMLGYSSVMHMGYIFLGIAAFNPLGLSGAALLMFAHGLSIAALFALSGQLRQRTDTLAFSDLGGLAKQMPLLGFVFGLAAFASIGLPGFGNFASEIMIFFGAFGNAGEGLHFTNIQIATMFALWGVVISAVYMLRGYRAVFMGPVDKRWTQLPDLGCSLRWPIFLLLAALLVAGFCPRLFIHFIQPGLQAILAHARP